MNRPLMKLVPSEIALPIEHSCSSPHMLSLLASLLTELLLGCSCSPNNIKHTQSKSLMKSNYKSYRRIHQVGKGFSDEFLPWKSDSQTSYLLKRRPRLILDKHFKGESMRSWKIQGSPSENLPGSAIFCKKKKNHSLSARWYDIMLYKIKRFSICYFSKISTYLQTLPLLHII